MHTDPIWQAVTLAECQEYCGARLLDNPPTPRPNHHHMHMCMCMCM